MIEADGPVAVLGQPLGRGLDLGHSFRPAGKRRFIDHALVGLHPRNMGITEKRQPVRQKPHRQIDRTDDVIDTLAGQTVHEVEVDGIDTGIPQVLDGGGGGLERLHAVDRLLDVPVEILNAQAGAGDAGLGQGFRHFPAERPGVDFHRHLGIGGETETLPDGAHERREILLGKHGRRAAAPMHMDDIGGCRHGVGDQGQLLVEHGGIIGDRLMALDDFRVATAIPAHGGAERHMEIKRKGIIAADG